VMKLREAGNETSEAKGAYPIPLATPDSAKGDEIRCVFQLRVSWCGR
jgi:hypothetical protein